MLVFVVGFADGHLEIQEFVQFSEIIATIEAELTGKIDT